MLDFSANPFVPGEQVFVKGAQTGPLAGLGFVAKDNFDIAGRRTGLGLPNEGAMAMRHADVVASCLAGGADLLGKVIMDALAYSVLGLNTAYGPPLNPAAPGRVAGGSSCGSASAVAQGLADFALGTDTAGSVRAPASFCGLWGLRPTHGALSSEGMAPLAHSFDVPGWLCADAQIMRRVSEALLPHSAPRVIDTAIICDWLFEERGGRRTDAMAWARQRNLRVEHYSAPPVAFESMLSIFRTIQSREAYLALSRFIDTPDIPEDIAERLRAGAHITPDALAASYRARADLVASLDNTLDVAVMLAPAAPSPPLLSRLQSASARQEARTLILTHTILASLAGAPQVSAPMWCDEAGPVGLGVIAARGADRALVELCVDGD